MLNKGNSKENRKTTYILGKIFTNHATDKGFISKIHKQLHNSTSKTNNLIKIWAEDLNRHFSRRHTNGQEAYEKMFNVTVKEIRIKKLECPIISYRSECVCVCACVYMLVTQSYLTLCNPIDQFSKQEYWTRLPLPSQRDFPDPGTNLGLPHSRQTLYRLTHQGSPYWSEWPLSKTLQMIKSGDGIEKREGS